MFPNIRKAIVLGVGVFTLGLFQSASADWSENNGVNYYEDRQDIVITLKSNPVANLEQACLSVTFARMLSGQGHNVTLFVTLDGVALAKDQGRRAHRRMCTTPPSLGGEMSLIENLEKFLGDDDSKMVVCPICWVERYGYDEDDKPVEPDYGVLPGLTAPGNAIAIMIGNAEKILDF